MRSRADHPRSRGVYGRTTPPSSRSARSSPLARGLLGYPRRRHHRLRIIPARAGFTIPPVKRGMARRDHPRSRGVYFWQCIRTRVSAGSSPLARGLLWAVTAPDGRIGIIPARAGFTGSWPPARRAASGSSPLARGLRGCEEGRRCVRGIIPARAGFTEQGGFQRHERGGSSPLARGLRDLVEGHPLGDGIIPARAGFTSTAPGSPPPDRGSSPLARGLPLPARPTPREPRIIPARAGFTGPCPTGSGRGRDHPRSRGVYGADMGVVAAVMGSSPLARGLPVVHVDDRASQRIIPARAGFTTRPGRRRCGRSDHPRSRGVYAYLIRGLRADDGSSPLARGLLVAGAQRRREDGIIPARAGFTHPTWTPARYVRDHPRSRGVYWAGSPAPSPPPGSSPLARGLPDPARIPAAGRGIIPARAGFTRSECRGSWRSRDHPRSRGVYRRTGCLSCSRIGSSPLARGLRWAFRAAEEEGGIIPARAGFTPRSGG